MANVFQTPQRIASNAAAILQDHGVIYGALRSGYVSQADFPAGGGRTVDITLPAVVESEEFSGAYGTQEVQEGKVTVALQRINTKRIKLSVENLNLDIGSFTQQLLMPAAASLADKVNDFIWRRAIAGLNNWAGTVGTDPTKIADFVYPNVVLMRNRSQNFERIGLLGSTDGHGLQTNDNLTKVNEAGGEFTLRQGATRRGLIGQVGGITWWQDQAPTNNPHQIGTYDNGTVVTNGAMLATDTTLVMSGGEAVGTVNAGDLLNLAGITNADGSLKQFVVTTGGTAVAGGVSVEIYPAPGVAVPDATAVTFAGTAGGTMRKNLVADRGYLAAAVLPTPTSEMNRDYEFAVNFPEAGYGVTMRWWPPDKTDGSSEFLLECQVAAQVVRPEMGCLLIA